MNAHVEELRHRVPVPAHLLSLDHPLGHELVDGGFGKPGGDSPFVTMTLTIVRQGIGIHFEIANGVEQRLSEFSHSGDVLEASCLRPLPQVHQTDQPSFT
ncbi:MAG: hypothetical protein JOZ45_12270 [Acidobacteriaceae bacterium]|nr:hypothetical protein [Acidobacteriaceae bacterium]